MSNARHKGLHLARQTHCELRTGHCQRKTAQRKVQATATSTQQQQDTSKSPHSNSKGAFADFEPPPVIPASQLNLEDADLEEGPDDPAFELHEQDPRAQGGYTPFETLDFSDDDITHEVTVHVNAPRSKCFQIWLDRLNYLEWFDITQLIMHRHEAHLASMFMFYQWGTTPMLELYTTVSRSQVEEDELILEESVDGMDFVAGTIFADAESGSGTDVTFRLGYYLPVQLKEFVGPVAIYGDVNDILEESMQKMKAFIEKADLEKLKAHRAADYKGMEQHVCMNEAVFQEQHGTEEEIYAAARDTAAEFLENFDEAMAEEEEWRQSQQAEKDEREQADTTEDPAATQAQEREVTDQWTDTAFDEEDPITDSDFEVASTSDSLSDPLTDSEIEAGPSTSAQTTGFEGSSDESQPSPSVANAQQSQRNDPYGATESEQQAAANMPSMGQQDVGQFDPEQAARVSVEQNLDSGTASISSTGEAAATFSPDLDEADTQQPKSSLTAYGQKKGRPKTKREDESKPKKAKGRPRKVVE